MSKRVLILASTLSYRSDDFARAAARLGLQAVLGTDRCHVLAEVWDREKFGGSLQVELRDVAEAAQTVVAEARARGCDAIIPTDDPTAEIAAVATRALGLSGNAPEAARTARNKRLLREALQRAGLPGPTFTVHTQAQMPTEVTYPCVIKPILCSASRGVMRADGPAELAARWQRLVALLNTPALRAVDDPDGHRILVESFVPGPEVAVEGILRDGRLTVLALFDKPDPLDGPYFEETIYVTPSRHPAALQATIAAMTARAAAAVGLVEGPVHAELRLSPEGPILIEIAARSIGGLCARTLRFALPRAEGEGAPLGAAPSASLEEIVLRNALGLPLGSLERTGAAGVMMIPIPRGGVFQEAVGEAEARAVPLIEDVVISARPGQVVVPLPEGNAYLGFLFARGDEPAAVEAALRRAHAALDFRIAPTLT